MKAYRCYNCVGDNGTPGKDFEGDAPKCSNCGVDATGNPRLAGLIVALEVIHFDAPSPVRGVGVGFRACNPKRRLPDGNGVDQGTRFTGHPAAVTCPGCKATEAFRKATAEVSE